MDTNLILFIILWVIVFLLGLLFAYSLFDYLNTPEMVYSINDTYDLWGL